MITKTHKVTYGAGNSCWFWHRWELVEVSGGAKYSICRDCAARRIEHKASARARASHLSLRFDWLMGVTDSICRQEPPRNPPPKRP